MVIAEEPISSPGNARFRAARKLLSGSAARHKAGRFLVEGPQAVREALAEPGLAAEVFVAADAPPGLADDLGRAASEGVPIRVLAPELLDQLCQTVTPQGVVAVCGLLGSADQQVWADSPRLVVGLERAQDPGNAGTIIRTADAVGADAVVLSTESVDVHNPKVVRATAGSIFHLPLVLEADLVSVAEQARRRGMTVLAATGAGEVDLGSREAAGLLRGPVLWLFGNESRGLSAPARSAADAEVRVPIFGRAESLNLAVAAGICLYATADAQRAPVGSVPPANPRSSRTNP